MKAENENKSLEEYLFYAKELENICKVASDCCITFYLEKFIQYKQRCRQACSKDENKRMSELLKQVELSQKKLGFSIEERKQKLEDFCSKIFLAFKVEEETAEQITEEIAAQYHYASKLIDLLSLFEGISSEWKYKSNI